MKVISVEDVSKRFILSSSRATHLGDAARNLFGRQTREEFWALKDVNFDVDCGEALGIIGHNGAGKSTMLKLLTRIMDPTSGSIRTRGRISALIEIGAGFHPEMTGRENIFLNGSILGMTRREISRKFDEIVAFADLEQFIDTPVKRYSSGMYARLGFAVIAHLEAEILLVDEVLSVGDEAFQTKCQERMSNLMNSGVTVLFVSHNLPAVAALCPRTLVLHHGQVIFNGESAEAIRVARKAAAQTVKEDKGDSTYSEDRPVRVLGVRLLDSSGAETEEIPWGSKLIVEVTGETDRDLSSLNLGVLISRADGVKAFDVNSRMDAHVPAVPAGRFVYRCEISECNLTDGIYFLTVGLMDGDERVHYHLVRQCAYFRVVDDALYRGVARLRHSWHVQAVDSETVYQ